MKTVVTTKVRDYTKFPESPDLIVLEGTEPIAVRYNRAVDTILADGYVGWINFIHDDCHIKSNENVVFHQLRLAYESGHLVAGLIGTYNLEDSFQWWHPNRDCNGVGSIYQVKLDSNGKVKDPYEEYLMNDWRGFHSQVCTVDGCCMWIHTDAFKKIRFDENISPYDYYDVDICLQALYHKMSICTIAVDAVHASAGYRNPSESLAGRTRMFSKWSPLVSGFPINALSHFKNDKDLSS